MSVEGLELEKAAVQGISGMQDILEVCGGMRVILKVNGDMPDVCRNNNNNSLVTKLTPRLNRLHVVAQVSLDIGSVFD